MERLSDCIFMYILQYLEVKELLNCCRVCRHWRTVIYDSSLWLSVDLRPYRWRLDNKLIVKLIRNRFQPQLKSLNLSGFTLTPEVFKGLHFYCKNLKSLMLENASFIGFNDKPQSELKFPLSLEYLDMRYSNGDAKAFQLIESSISGLQCFGVTNSVLLYVDHVRLFRNMRNIRVLDFSYCNSLYDPTFILISNFCLGLRSLSLSHCNNINGADLFLITKNCKRLKVLSISGTSLTDDNISNCKWDGIHLEELDVSWCRNITESGLLALLPNLLDLTYLRLRSCGFGHAITDRVLDTLSSNQHKELEILDISYSREISNKSVANLIRSLTSLRQLRVSCCSKLTSNLLHTTEAFKKDVLVYASSNSNNQTAIPNGRLHVIADSNSTSLHRRKKWCRN